jgi:PAS domain S-box-containing protein
VQNANNEIFKGTDINQNALLESMVEGVILQDLDGNIIQCNQSALEILGTNKDQLNIRVKGTDNELNLSEWEKVFPGRYHPGMTSLVTGEIQKNISLRIFRDDGEMRWISLNSVPIFDNNKKPLQLINTFTDITEINRILNDLKQVQLLFNISHDLMIIANKDGFFKKINPRFIDVLGYELNEISSEKFLNFVHAEDLDETTKKLGRLGEQNENIHFINRYKTKKNDYRIFDWVVVPDPETNLIYFTARDITEYQEEELEILHSSKVYSVGELTSSIAYLLNAQLSIIAGNISFLQTQMSNERIATKDLKDKVDGIMEAISKISKTTKDLSSFSRYIENERVSNIPLNRILANITDLIQEKFRIHGVKLNIKLENNLIIHSRESQIVHAFINLLNIVYNFIHSERESWVELIGSSSDNLIHITITYSSKSEKDSLNKKLEITKKIIEENFGTFYMDQSAPNNRFIIEFPKVLNET